MKIAAASKYQRTRSVDLTTEAKLARLGRQHFVRLLMCVSLGGEANSGGRWRVLWHRGDEGR